MRYSANGVAFGESLATDASSCDVLHVSFLARHLRDETPRRGRRRGRAPQRVRRSRLESGRRECSIVSAFLTHLDPSSFGLITIYGAVLVLNTPAYQQTIPALHRPAQRWRKHLQHGASGRREGRNDHRGGSWHKGSLKSYIHCLIHDCHTTP